MYVWENILILKQIAAQLFFQFLILVCAAQDAADSSVIYITDINNEKIAQHKIQLFIDSSSSLPVTEVLQKPFFLMGNYKRIRKLPPSAINYTFYLKIFLNNNTVSESSVYLFPGLHFKQFNIYKAGPPPVQYMFADSINGYRKITMASGEAGYILAALKPLKNDINYIEPVLIKGSNIRQFTKNMVGHKPDNHLFGLVISGVLLMMILFMVASYIINKKKEYLFNALYSLCMFLLVYLNAMMVKSTSAFSYLYYSYLDFFLLVTGIFFYIIFTRSFLETKNFYVQLDKVLKYTAYFVLIQMGIYTILHFFSASYLPQFYLENIMKFFLLFIGLIFIFLAIKQKNKLLNYIAAGNAMLVIFSAISLLILLVKIKPAEIYQSALFYYYIGIVSQLVFFLLGLNYKNRSELIRNIKEQEALKLEAKKKEFETQLAVIKAQQEERNRISADMHDDLGAGMTTISLYSELAKGKLRNNPIPEIEKISTSANELLNKMNAIIWSMSSSNDTLSNMIAYIRSYAQEYFDNTGVTCRISLPENLPNIEVIGKIRRNVFLVVKEALNNILKHAEATEVTITLLRVEDGLTLFIHDNGKGINLDNLRQFGNGLKNMKKRMNDIKIEFTIEKNNGTLITMHRKIKSF